MAVMCSTLLDGPSFHPGGDLIGHTSVYLASEFHCRQDSFVSLLGHVSPHLVKVEHILAKILRYRPFFNIEALCLMRGRLI